MYDKDNLHRLEVMQWTWLDQDKAQTIFCWLLSYCSATEFPFVSVVVVSSRSRLTELEDGQLFWVLFK